MKKQNNKLKMITRFSLMIALATVLSLLKIWEAPLGGAVTLFSMLPIIVISVCYGVKSGLATAFIYSLLQLLLGLGTVAYVPSGWGIAVCCLLDYIVAFTVLGLAGVTSKMKLVKNEMLNKTIAVGLGVLMVCILRYLSHLISGAVVWYEITKVGQWNDFVNQVGMWTYSAVYNMQFMLPETIISVVATPVIVKVVDLIRRMDSRESKNS